VTNGSVIQDHLLASMAAQLLMEPSFAVSAVALLPPYLLATLLQPLSAVPSPVLDFPA